MEDVEICKIVMGFLRHAGYYETCSSLQLESNVGQGKMSEELLFLQTLTLQGRWDDTLRYLQPMRRILLHNFERLEFMIKKQQYLEALSWLGVGGQRHALMPWRPPKKKNTSPSNTQNLDESAMTFGDDEDDVDMDMVASLLKQLEGKCSQAVFNHLCVLLTLERLSDDDVYRTWTVAQGRLECFRCLRNALYTLLPGDNEALYEDDKDIAHGNRLRHLLLHGLAAEGNRAGTSLPASLSSSGALPDASHGEPDAATTSAPLDNEAKGDGAANINDLDAFEAIGLSDAISARVQEALNASVTSNIYFEEEDIAAAAEAATSDYFRGAESAEPSSKLGSEFNPAEIAAEEVAEEDLILGVEGRAEFGAGCDDDDDALFRVTASPVWRQSGNGDRVTRNIYSEDSDGDENGLLAHPGIADPVMTKPPAKPASPVRVRTVGNTEVLIDDKNAIEIHVPKRTKGSMLPVPVSSYAKSANSKTGSGGIAAPTPPPADRTLPPQNPQEQASRRPPAQKEPKVENTRPVSWTVDVSNASPARNPAGPKHVGGAPSSPRSLASAQSALTSTTAGSGQRPRLIAAPSHNRAPVRRGGTPSDYQSTFSGAGAESAGLPPPLPIEKPNTRPAGAVGYGSNVSVASTHSGQSASATTVTNGYSARHASPSKLSEPSLATTITGKGGSSGSTAGGGGASVATRQTLSTAFTADSVAPLPVDAIRHNQALKESSTHDASHAAAFRKAVVAPDGDRSVQSLETHRAWLVRGQKAPIWSMFQRAPCPLRCLNPIRNASGDLEVLVGSNNRSISHLRRAADIGAANESPAEIESEWIECHRGSIYCVDYSAGQRLFASGSNDKTVRLGKLRGDTHGRSGNPTAGELSAPMKGHTGTVRVVKFAPPLAGPSGGASESSLHLVGSAGAGDNKPRLWDVSTGALHSTLFSHNAAVHGLVWLDGTTLLTGCEEGHVIAHDIRMSGAAWRYSIPAGGICTMISMPNPQDTANKWIACGHNGGAVSIFNARSGAIMASDRLHSDDVRALDVLIEPKQVVKSFSGTSRKIPSMPALVTTSFDGTAALWGVSHSQTGLPMTGATGGNSDRGRFDRLSLLSGAHTDKVLGVCVLQHSQNILTSGADGVVALWSPPAAR